MHRVCGPQTLHVLTKDACSIASPIELPTAGRSELDLAHKQDGDDAQDLETSTHLQVGWQLRVDGQNEQLRDTLAEIVQSLLQGEARSLDLLLARHEDEYVPWWMPCS